MRITALPTRSDVRVEQMVPFVTDAEKLIAIAIMWRIPSPYWRASVKLLPKEKSKQEGSTQQFSGAHTSWDRVGTKC